jgi:hypothetical protein
MVAGDGDERFRFAVDVVTDGLVARVVRRSRTEPQGSNPTVSANRSRPGLDP